jgi:DNA-binding winged helix-turn-helix (wHTH) protein
MADSYTFGPFRLDVSAEILFRDAEPLPVGRRAVSLLRKLLEQPGAPVSKEALIEAAWPDLAVEESNLTVQISVLRRVLGSTPDGDRWIETMPRRGYRFIGPVGIEVQKSTLEALAQVDNAPELAPTPHKDTERRQVSAKISSRSKSSRAPALWASWRIGQLLREMTIRSVATLACSAQRVAASSRAEPRPRRRQSASIANATSATPLGVANTSTTPMSRPRRAPRPCRRPWPQRPSHRPARRSCSPGGRTD